MAILLAKFVGLTLCTSHEGREGGVIIRIGLKAGIDVAKVVWDSTHGCGGRITNNNDDGSRYWH